MQVSYKFVDLFAGAGGFSEGFLQCKYKGKSFNFILASDIHENSELTHRVRYNVQLGLDVKFLRKDIVGKDFLRGLDEKLNGEKIDVVCGGPPCQGFSLAGRREKGDRRDYLFEPFLAAIEHLRPKYFVMENVPGILSKENGKLAKTLLKSIRSITSSRSSIYQIECPIIVNASDYGVPQNRTRVLFIGCRKDQEVITSIPPTTGENKVTVFEALHDLEGVENGSALKEYPTSIRQDLPERLPDGRKSSKGKTYAEWSRVGRLNQSPNGKKLPYVGDLDHLNEPAFAELQNHQASSHTKHVRERYRLIRMHGGYDKAKETLKKRKLLNNKMNYKLLEKTSPPLQ